MIITDNQNIRVNRVHQSDVVDVLFPAVPSTVFFKESFQHVETRIAKDDSILVCVLTAVCRTNIFFAFL